MCIRDSTGSSWTTAATLGVAFVGISRVIGVSEAVTAGAVISGAYFGDKMTPLSETTILTPQIVGSNVYGHIRSMAKISIPAYLIALAIFFFMGRSGEDVYKRQAMACGCVSYGHCYCCWRSCPSRFWPLARWFKMAWTGRR